MRQKGDGVHLEVQLTGNDCNSSDPGRVQEVVIKKKKEPSVGRGDSKTDCTGQDIFPHPSTTIHLLSGGRRLPATSADHWPPASSSSSASRRRVCQTPWLPARDVSKWRRYLVLPLVLAYLLSHPAILQDTRAGYTNVLTRTTACLTLSVCLAVCTYLSSYLLVCSHLFACLSAYLSACLSTQPNQYAGAH